MRRNQGIALAHGVFALTLLVVGSSGSALARPAAPSYAITDLGSPLDRGPVPTLTSAGGINDAGQVVANVSGSGGTFGLHAAFVWQRGVGFKRLPPLRPGVDADRAVAINDRGQIAGSASGVPFVPSPTTYLVLWQPTGRRVQIGPPDGPLSGATGLNNRGQVVGTLDGHNFLWSQSEGLRDLGGFSPKGINDHGEIVGVVQGHAALWQPRRGVKGLGDFSPSAMNDRGDVVGTSQGHAVLWDRATGLQRIGEFTPAAINGKGQVVGSAHSPSGGRAVVWQAGVGTQELPGLPGVDSARGASEIDVSAADVSDRGQIVGAVNWKAADDPGNPGLTVFHGHIVVWQLQN